MRSYLLQEVDQTRFFDTDLNSISIIYLILPKARSKNFKETECENLNS